MSDFFLRTFGVKKGDEMTPSPVFYHSNPQRTAHSLKHSPNATFTKEKRRTFRTEPSEVCPASYSPDLISGTQRRGISFYRTARFREKPDDSSHKEHSVNELSSPTKPTRHSPAATFGSSKREICIPSKKDQSHVRQIVDGRSKEIFGSINLGPSVDYTKVRSPAVTISNSPRNLEILDSNGVGPAAYNAEGCLDYLKRSGPSTVFGTERREVALKEPNASAGKTYGGGDYPFEHASRGFTFPHSPRFVGGRPRKPGPADYFVTDDWSL